MTPRGHRLDVAEASGLVRLAGDRFLVADDELGIVLAARDGAARRLIPENGVDLDDAEGLCLTADGAALLVVAEGSGVVHRVPLVGRGPRLRLGPAERLGRLPEIGTGKAGKRKGWEGLAVLPAALGSVGRDLLVAVHEARPQAVGLFELPGLELLALLPPPTGPDELSELDDLSDVAVDPRDGSVLVLSDESRAVVVADLVRAGGELRLVARTRIALPLGEDEKPEGLDVAPGGRLLVVCDGSGRLLDLPLPAARRRARRDR